jgi:hypothetical protein
MARARNIKPGFFTNEELVELPFATRLLFIGLWTEADRAGRMEDKPKRIKMKLFPADDLDVDNALQQLHDKGFLLRYEAAGERYIQILAFDKHQNPHKDERKSGIPAPDLHGASNEEAHDLNSTNPADSPIPDSLPLIPDTQTKPSPARKKPAPGEDEKFAEAYSLYPSRPGSSKASALKAWQARIASGVDPDDMIAGVKRYANFVRQSRTEPNFIKMPATFFGPDRHFDSDWTFVPKTAGPPGYQTANDKAKAWADSLTGKNRNHEPDDRTIIDLNDAPTRKLG